MLRLLCIFWAAPNSLIGILLGGIGLLSGGRVQLRRGCLEFYGGAVTSILNRLPPHGVMAMTLGHTIVGRSRAALSVVRDHEQVHVRQYERWGPLFIPAYLGCSFWLWLQKRDAYYENPFEVEAYAISDPIHPEDSDE